MKIKAKKDYVPAPEYQGVAVCVDITEPRERETQWGLREEIRFVFEIPVEMDDGKRYIVRSAPMTTSLHEKASLRKFIRGMRGRDLKGDELKEFDTETLVGKSVNISIIHEETEDGRLFDQIALCRPWDGDSLDPSGDYTREKDRKKDKGSSSSRQRDDDDEPKSSKESTYRRTESAGKKSGPTEYGSIKSHVGRHKGIELRDLTEESIKMLIERWLEGDFRKIEKPSADDKRLAAALEWYRGKYSGDDGKGEEDEPDDVPY